MGKQLPPCQYHRKAEITRRVVEKCTAFMNTIENKLNVNKPTSLLYLARLEEA
jgi:Mn-dependent DtxR family transcriptional regulator